MAKRDSSPKTRWSRTWWHIPLLRRQKQAHLSLKSLSETNNKRTKVHSSWEIPKINLWLPHTHLHCTQYNHTHKTKQIGYELRNSQSSHRDKCKSIQVCVGDSNIPYSNHWNSKLGNSIHRTTQPISLKKKKKARNEKKEEKVNLQLK